MKLLRVHIISAKTCGGLLDGLNLVLRNPNVEYDTFDPLCFIGQNGAGKSQFLQVLAELFQSVFHACLPLEERVEGNSDLLFEVEYLISNKTKAEINHIKISRKDKKSKISIQKKKANEWMDCELNSSETHNLLPRRIVGYTSGENETLSVPFIISRGGYAEDVRTTALSTDQKILNTPINETRLMMLDYATHLEVLIANLLLGNEAQQKYLLQDARLEKLHSFRCIIQLAHSAINKIDKKFSAFSGRKGVQLTPELEEYIKRLQKCATSYTYDNKTETYIFDFWVNEATKNAFKHYWESPLELYSTFHKFGMLNDLAIPRNTRNRYKKDILESGFASHLPEPQDEDKVFRFEKVKFIPEHGKEIVDYVSLSDGEHQLAQILGTFCMLSFPNILFLLDEPESHFNPLWRIKFITRILELPTKNGARGKDEDSSHQDCILTTHSPFVPSDMFRKKVFIFKRDSESTKVKVERPQIETYGSTFDTILEECFEIRPPISQVPKDDIDNLLESDDPKEVMDGIRRLGDSVEKAYLANHLRELEKRGIK